MGNIENFISRYIEKKYCNTILYHYIFQYLYDTKLRVNILNKGREKLNTKESYLDAKNHPTLDIIAISSFYIEMSENHLILDAICTLAKFHIWI